MLFCCALTVIASRCAQVSCAAILLGGPLCIASLVVHPSVSPMDCLHSLYFKNGNFWKAQTLGESQHLSVTCNLQAVSGVETGVPSLLSEKHRHSKL